MFYRGVLERLNIGSMTVADLLKRIENSTDGLKTKLPTFKKLIQQYANATTSIDLDDIAEGSNQNLQDLFKKFNIRPSGDKFSQMLSVELLPGKGKYLTYFNYYAKHTRIYLKLPLQAFKHSLLVLRFYLDVCLAQST